MIKQRGKLKSKNVKKINPPKITDAISVSNVVIPDEVIVSSDAITDNCDTPHCGSKAEAIINNMKYCKQCAQDHRL